MRSVAPRAAARAAAPRAQVCTVLVGFSIGSWFAPNVAGTVLFINVASGWSFLYYRNTPEVPLDDFGQVGEIRPLESKPLIFSLIVTAAMYIWGSVWSRRVLATVANPSKPLEVATRTTCVSLLLLFPSLFMKARRCTATRAR